MDKTYAGGRLRRLRESRSMSQADLARLLAISPSYVNLMEHNSRPLTVPVLLKLTESFGVDLDFFAPKDTARLVADVREVVTDDAARSATGRPARSARSPPSASSSPSTRTAAPSTPTPRPERPERERGTNAFSAPEPQIICPQATVHCVL